LSGRGCVHHAGFIRVGDQWPLQNVNAELLTAAIDHRCQRYLTQRSSQINAAQLKVIVHAAAVDELRLSAVLKLGLEGQVNDAPVRITARAQRTVGNHGEKSMHRLLKATERLLTEAPTEAKLTDTIGGERLDQCDSHRGFACERLCFGSSGGGGEAKAGQSEYRSARRKGVTLS